MFGVGIHADVWLCLLHGRYVDVASCLIGNGPGQILNAKVWLDTLNKVLDLADYLSS